MKERFNINHQKMDIKKSGIALGVAAGLAGGAAAEESSGVSFQEWAQANPDQAKQVLASSNQQREKVKEIVEAGSITKQQIADIHSNMQKQNAFSYDVAASKNYLQANTSFIHKNMGVGLQLTHTDKVDQAAITAGIELTPDENSALSRVIQNGQLKVSVVKSEVENALADFDETGAGLEFVLNLKNALVKQVSIAHSDHDLTITDGSDVFRVANVDVQTSISSRNEPNRIIQTTQVDTTTTEKRNVAEDVNQTAVSVLLGLTKDLDVMLSYARDSLGENLTAAELEYRLNDQWSIHAASKETRRDSGSQVQDIQTAAVEYKKGNWSAIAGVRDNGFTTSPYAGLQYQKSFGAKSENASTSSKMARNIASSLTKPVLGSTEIHPHAISQQTRVTTQTEISELVDTLAKGKLSNIKTTTDSCRVSFNVNDPDGVKKVIVLLSNGDVQTSSASKGTVVFAGLPDNTRLGMKLFVVSNNPITGATQQVLLDEASCKTEKKPQPETPEENPTVVSAINGSTTIQVGDTPNYSITATDENGINSVTASVNGSNVPVTQSGDTYSITLPASASASAGTADIEFSVAGNKADGSADTPVAKSESINVEAAPVPEKPTIVSSVSGSTTIQVGDTPNYSITATDENGINSVTATVNGSNVTVTQSGDTYSIALPASASASAGTANIEFSVTGNKADGSADTPVTESASVTVEQPISTPMINPIGTQNIQDNGGGLPTNISVSGADIQSGAVWSLVTPITGLTINSSTGTMTFDDDVGGNQSFTVTVKVTNPDTGSDTDTFTLNVEDNG